MVSEGIVWTGVSAKFEVLADVAILMVTGMVVISWLKWVSYITRYAIYGVLIGSIRTVLGGRFDIQIVHIHQEEIVFFLDFW